jgi:hypothetical protein
MGTLAKAATVKADNSTPFLSDVETLREKARKELDNGDHGAFLLSSPSLGGAKRRSNPELWIASLR